MSIVKQFEVSTANGGYQPIATETSVVPPPKSESDEFVKQRPGRPSGISNPNARGRLHPRPKRTISEQLLSQQERWAFFVRAWQESSCTEEVSRKTGLNPLTCRSKASTMRRLGVRLKMMPHLPPYNVDDLNKLVDAIEESKLSDKFNEVKYGSK